MVTDSNGSLSEQATRWLDTHGFRQRPRGAREVNGILEFVTPGIRGTYMELNTVYLAKGSWTTRPLPPRQPAASSRAHGTCCRT